MGIRLHAVDIAIVVAYFVLIVCVGLWFSRKRDGDEDDYFVAGRELGWVAIGASLFASNISSEHLIGLAADGFRAGLAVGNYEWAASIILLVLGGVFVPFYVGTRVRTMPEFLERRFGRGARVLPVAGDDCRQCARADLCRAFCRFGRHGRALRYRSLGLRFLVLRSRRWPTPP